jgi:glutathione synthase/RimK-type ligase-like ATP-grasp enzyme
MVIIISNDTDRSANLLLDWLIFYKIKFIRLNKNDRLKLKFLSGEIFINYSQHLFKLDDVVGIFTRGVWFNFDTPLVKHDYFNNEYKQISEYVTFILNKHSNAFLNRGVINKLIVNNIAKEVGSKTPKESIVELKQDLEKLLSQYLNLCTKSLSGINTIEYKKKIKFLYTLKLKEQHLDNLKLDKFHPSLIQEYIGKNFEIRSFVLNNNFFSMAIFSQKKNDASHDYRKEYSNLRTCVIKLPESIENKIIQLFSKLNLKSGSIDLIYTKNKEFYFLEVNPSGQFNFLSEVSNFNIENEIVKLFLKK